MKRVLILILILINVTAYSQNIRITKQLRQQKTSGIYRLQLDTTGNEDYGDLSTKEYVQYWVANNGGNGYTNGYGLGLTSTQFNVDTNLIATRAWRQKGIDSTIAALNALNLATYARKQDSSIAGGYYPYSTNPKSYLTNISGFLSQGSNVVITGSGTLADPYLISSTGSGGSGANSNIGSGYRWVVANTQNIKTYFNGYALLTDSTTNTNGLTTKVDSATLSTYYLRRKDSTVYYPYASNPSNYITQTVLTAGYVPLTRLVSTGNGLSGGGALSGNLTLKADTLILETKLAHQKAIDSLAGIGINISTCLVVSKSGVDATGTRGKFDKPFLTIRAALNAASSGDLIMVYPGTYEEASPISLAKGVNYSFIGSGIVQLTTSVGSGAVFTDSTTVSTSTIIASGWKFEGRSTQIVLNQSAASTVTMQVNEMVSSNGKTINTGTNSITTITANRVAGNAFSATIWLASSAKFVADIKFIEAGVFGECLWTSNAKYVNIHAQRIFVNDPTNDDYLIMIASSNATDSIYIEAQELKAGTEWAVWAKGLSPAIHIKAQHISANSDCVVVSSTDPGGMLTVQSDVVENTTTGAMDGIVHGEGGSLTLIGSKIIRNSASTGADIKTVIFGGDTGYVKLVAVAYDKTKMNESPSGTITRVDNYFNSGIGAANMTNTDTVQYLLGVNATTKDFVRVAKSSVAPLTGSLAVSLTDGATISTDASLGYSVGATYRVTLGGSRVIANPTNLIDGQRIVFEIKQDATGSRTVTWGSMFTWSDDIPLVTLSTTASYVDLIGFVYNATAGKLYVTGVNIGLH